MKFMNAKSSYVPTEMHAVMVSFACLESCKDYAF